MTTELTIQTDTAEIQRLTTEAAGLAEMAAELNVTSATLEDATNLLSWIAANKKRLEEQRTFLVRPLNEHVKSINAQFKTWTAPLDEADQTVRGKVLAYSREQARIAAEARAAEEARIAAEQRRLEAAAAVSGEIALPPMPGPVVSLSVAAERTTRAALGTATVRKLWTFEIVDPAAVPREYLLVDESKIRAVMKAGVREIPGVRIYETEGLAVKPR